MSNILKKLGEIFKAPSPDAEDTQPTPTSAPAPESETPVIIPVAFEDTPTLAAITKPLDNLMPVPAVVNDPPQLLVGCAQSVGLQRDHNEDSLFTLTTTLANNDVHLPLGIYIVADGMGGHRHGELASGMAVRSMGSHLIQKVMLGLVAPQSSTPDDSILEIMQSGVQEAHRSILKEIPGGGTTLTAVLIIGEQVTIAHVGDTRAYIIEPDGTTRILTNDHSLVNKLVELGQLTTEEAAFHPQRNVLYRALGQGEPFDADVNLVSVSPGGEILLCSDGLWGQVSDAEISRIVLEKTSLQEACQQLVDAANAAGGPDNITAIIVRMPG